MSSDSSPQHQVDPLVSAAMKRDHDSMDDFEHLEHGDEKSAQLHQLIDLPQATNDLMTHAAQNLESLTTRNLLDSSIPANVDDLMEPVPATPPPSADCEKFGNSNQPVDPFEHLTRETHHDFLPKFQDDPKAATLAFMQTERSPHLFQDNDDLKPLRNMDGLEGKAVHTEDKKDFIRDDDIFARDDFGSLKAKDSPKILDSLNDADDFIGNVKMSVFPTPENAPERDFLRDEIVVKEATKEKVNSTNDIPYNVEESWNVLEKPESEKYEDMNFYQEPPTKPLPAPPVEEEKVEDILTSFDRPLTGQEKYEMTNDFLLSDSPKAKGHLSGTETGDSEFESEPEPSPAKHVRNLKTNAVETNVNKPQVYGSEKKSSVTEKVPKEIFKSMSLDAWFNPERLNPKVAALIYWRDPKKSGIVFGAILGVLLSLAYFSLISVFAYISLLVLTGTVIFRIYKTVLQAVQKTSDGHPFKDILELDLTLPAEKVHEVADIAVANANGAVTELRRLFLVEDFVDSLKFGVLLWSLTYLGAWFNGMTLIIIGVVALFTLPKVYETNKTQIDQNIALVQGKINEVTQKVKVALSLGKKAEPAKEE